MGRIAWFTDGVTGVGAVVGHPDNFSGMTSTLRQSHSSEHMCVCVQSVIG